MATLTVSGIRINGVSRLVSSRASKLHECSVAYGDQLAHAITLIYVERLMQPSERRSVAILVPQKGSVLCTLQDVQNEFHPGGEECAAWIGLADSCSGDEYCILFVEHMTPPTFLFLKACWDDDAKARMQTDIGPAAMQQLNEHLHF
jgi:hypothetical protein